MNECEQDPDLCANDVTRVCVNTNGSYTCNCRLGYLENNANSVCEGTYVYLCGYAVLIDICFRY